MVEPATPQNAAEGVMNAVTDILSEQPEAPVQALALRALSPADAKAQTALSHVIDPLMLKSQGVTLMIGLDAPRPVSGTLPWLHLSIDGFPAALQLPWGVARRLAGIGVETSDAQDAALLMEAGIGAWLDEAEAATGLALRFERMDGTAPLEGVETSLNVKGKDVSGSFVEMRHALCLSVPAAERLAEALEPRQVPREDMPGLVMRLFWERDTMPMTQAELAGLSPGDALALSEDAPRDRIVLEGQFTARATLISDPGSAPAQLKLASIFHPLSTFEETPAMSDLTETLTPPEDQTEAATPEEIAALDDIDLQLSFRAGEAALPLRTLKTMGPGSIIEMTEPANATVSIMANGRLVGTGELIDVGGRRAVQIRRLFAGS
jgi:type III secretion protein Q